jgi:hypothetical protein
MPRTLEQVREEAQKDIDKWGSTSLIFTFIHEMGPMGSEFGQRYQILERIEDITEHNYMHHWSYYKS